MKTQIVLTGLFFVIGVTKSIAQTKDSTLPVKTGDEWRMPEQAVKQSKAFADWLKKELSLDDATTNRLFQAYLANTKPLDEIKVMAMPEKEKIAKLNANQTAFNETIKGILTLQQYKKYLSLPKP